MSLEKSTGQLTNITFWEGFPMPVAELGAALNLSEADLLDQLFTLLEAAVSLTVALGIARVAGLKNGDRGWAVKVVESLAKPSLGKRVQAVKALEAVLPGSTGWPFEERFTQLRVLLEKMESDRRIKRPRVRHAIDELVPNRNAKAHNDLSPEQKRALTSSLKQLHKPLLLTNRFLTSGQLLLVDKVQKLKHGEGFGFSATALMGSSARPYLKGQFQSHEQAASLEPDRVYLFEEGGSVLPLHPLVVAHRLGNDTAVYVLDRLQGKGPVLKRCKIADVVEWDTGWSTEMDSMLPGWRGPFVGADGEPVVDGGEPTILDADSSSTVEPSESTGGELSAGATSQQYPLGTGTKNGLSEDPGAKRAGEQTSRPGTSILPRAAVVLGIASLAIGLVMLCGRESKTFDDSLCVTGNGSPSARAEEHIRRGRELYTGNNSEAALTEFRCSALLAPSSASAHLWLSNALIKTQRYEEASVTARRALSLADEPVQVGAAHHNLCRAYEGLGHRAEAMRECQLSLSTRPGNANALETLRRLQSAQ